MFKVFLYFLGNQHFRTFEVCVRQSGEFLVHLAMEKMGIVFVAKLSMPSMRMTLFASRHRHLAPTQVLSA